MELIDARDRADTVRQYSLAPEEDALVILDNRITELEAQRDELLEACDDFLNSTRLNQGSTIIKIGIIVAKAKEKINQPGVAG